MATGERHQGTVIRTKRGYGQDLELIMGDDPVRAILELVTNADDAYEAMPHGARRKITIETERRHGAPDIIRVKDRAGSMTRAEAEDRLGQEGGRTSGFEQGHDRRGLLGRGAKDVVHFGQVEWDLTADSGEHRVFRLLYGSGGPSQRWESESVGRAASRRTGTIVTLKLQQHFRLPAHDNLVKRMTRHFGMRPILLDRRNRDVKLVDRGQEGRVNQLTYEPPIGRELAGDERISIPGYPDQYATINLYQSDESLDDGNTYEYWRHSLVIRSGRAAYDVFQGKFRRGPLSMYLGRLFGSVDSPYINQLIREYDDRRAREEDPDPDNPRNLLKRDRSGLVAREQHPFADALYSAIEDFLQPHLERIWRESETGSAPVNEETKRRNRNLGNLLGRLLQEEELTVEGGDGLGGSLPPIGLSLLPTTRIVEPSNPGYVTVRYRPDPEALPVDLPPVVAVSISDEDGLARESLLELRERSGYYSKGLSVGTREEGDISELTVSFFGQELSCLVQWQRRDTLPVEVFEFDNNSYALKEDVARVVRLLVPWDLVSQYDQFPKLSISGAPSISIVRDAGLVGSDERRDCAFCTITIKGRGVGSIAHLRARVGDMEASTTLTVTAAGVAGVRVEYEHRDDYPRVRLSEDGSTLFVNAANPAVARYLGQRRDDWPGQDSLHFRTMLAEVVTWAVSRHVIQNRRQHDERLDIYRIFYEHEQLTERWLPQVHRVLVPTDELRTAG